MIRIFTAYLFSFILLGCSNEPPPSPPTDSELIDLYLLKKDILHELDLAVRADLGKLHILKIDVEGLKPDSLSDERFSFYINRLNEIPSKRVTLYKGDVSFIVFNHGMVFAGCSSEIKHIANGQPFRPDWANPYQQVDLDSQWFGVTKCN